MPTVSLFGCTPALLRSAPGLAADLRGAGIRHCEMQLVRPLRNGESPDSYAANWDREQGEELKWCHENDYRVVGRMDDGLRTVGEREAFRNSRDKIMFVASAVQEWDIVDWVEAVDEIQQDPAQYPIDELSDWWRDYGAPPLAFPGHAPQRFERYPIAEVISRQWNWWTCKVGQDRLNRLRGSLVDAPKDGRPITAMPDVSGPRYRKRVQGTEYKPGKDQLLYNRRPPSLLNIEKQFKVAAEMGATRFRCWAIDTPEWAKLRAEAALGSVCDTGIGPGDERWAGFLQVLKRFTS